MVVKQEDVSFLRVLDGAGGGLPGVETSWAFAVVCLVLAVLAGLEIWLLRRLKWI